MALYLLACQAPSAVATGRVFNIGTGGSRTLNEVYACIAEHSASETFFTAPRSERARAFLSKILTH